MKPWGVALLVASLVALVGATLAIFDLRFELKLVAEERAFFGAQYQECFSRCGQ